jgi:hypothetical protein
MPYSTSYGHCIYTIWRQSKVTVYIYACVCVYTYTHIPWITVNQKSIHIPLWIRPHELHQFRTSSSDMVQNHVYAFASPVIIFRSHVRFEASTAMTIKSSVFCDDAVWYGWSLPTFQVTECLHLHRGTSKLSVARQNGMGRRSGRAGELPSVPTLQVETIIHTLKVKLSLCLINSALRHEDVWGSGDTAP